MDLRIEHLLEHKHHIPTIAAWQQEEFGYLSPQGTIGQRVERLNSADNRDQLPISLVAISGDQNDLAGSANIVATTLTHKHLSPWLSSVFVPAEQRGKGIASKLALVAIAEASRLGFDRIYLFTPRNETLYARLGWETFDHAVLNSVPVCLMARGTRVSQL
jgi:predicted N-acetyltransferase YhbS